MCCILYLQAGNAGAGRGGNGLVENVKVEMEHQSEVFVNKVKDLVEMVEKFYF